MSRPKRPKLNADKLAQALAHQVMLALQLTHLAEQGRHAAVLEERTRMARDIHDTLAQGFTGVIVQMEATEEALADEEPEEAIKHIRRARDLSSFMVRRQCSERFPSPRRDSAALPEHGNRSQQGGAFGVALVEVYHLC